MDTTGIDRLARAVGQSASRREALRLAVALLLGQGIAMAAREVLAQCAPDCAGRDCGDDGCGGSCGTCPGESACVESLGYCAASPGACGAVGEACGDGALGCCQLLECVGGVCTSPVCAVPGEACGDGIACCAGAECVLGSCLAVAPTCAPTGGDCAREECCEPNDTCIVGDGDAHVCTPTPPFVPTCARAGEQPAESGAPCCGRMRLERGRCVINRWGRCDKGGRSWCEQGTRCRGGRRSRRGHPVCVPT